MDSILNKLARHSFKKHSFLKEWGAFVILVLIVKIAAMAFSIFAGYFYLTDLYSRLFNNLPIAQTFSIINLILIETLTAIAISKFFKFLIYGSWIVVISTSFAVLMLFSVSFITSTNGLAMRQAAAVDKTTAINTAHNKTADEVKEEYSARAYVLKERIADEQKNPLGWKGTKRAYLTLDQLERIEKYYEDLKKLSQDRKAELLTISQGAQEERDQNDKLTKAEAAKFYNIVAFIMVLIFIVNGVLMFFFSKIYKPTPEETIDELTQQADELIDDIIKKRLNARLKPAAEVGSKECRSCGNLFAPLHPNSQFCENCQSNIRIIKRKK